MMKVTTDMHTGKPFRWNDVVLVRSDRGALLRVPALITRNETTWLNPRRTPPKLLAELNPELKSC